jgi:serine/threonine protein kinase
MSAGARPSSVSSLHATGGASTSAGDSVNLSKYSGKFQLGQSTVAGAEGATPVQDAAAAAAAQTAAAAAFVATAQVVPAPSAVIRPSSAHPSTRTAKPASFGGVGVGGVVGGVAGAGAAGGSAGAVTIVVDGEVGVDVRRLVQPQQRPRSAVPTRRAESAATSGGSHGPASGSGAYPAAPAAAAAAAAASSTPGGDDEFDDPATRNQPAPSQQEERERLQGMIRDKQWNGVGRPDCYVFGKLLGQGSFGTVRLAHHKITGHKVAVKSYERAKFKDEAQVKRCRQEIDLMKTLNHVHIVRLFEVFETSKRIHLVMEAASGGNLCAYVKSRKRLPESEAVRIFYHLALAIDYLHANGIVHRDVKLENVLFDSNRVIKLVDFGFSVRAYDKPLRVFCGTPSYMAPEIVRRKEYIGFPVDVWSLGVLLYAMLVGRFPFTAKTYPELYKKIAGGAFQIPEGISASVRDALRRMLTLAPEQRATIAELKAHRMLSERAETFPIVPSPNQCTHLISDDPNDDIVPALVKQLTEFGFPKDRLIRSIQERQRNHFTTTYYLLAMKAEKKRQLLAKAKADGTTTTSTAPKQP